MAIKSWNPDLVQAKTLKAYEQRMGQACALVERTVKQKLRISNRSGDNPSQPGEPPHLVSGRLMRSITSKVIRQGKNEVVGVVGSADPKARRLELGFVGVDSRGRRYNQAARPYLRPSVLENVASIKKILGVKK